MQVEVVRSAKRRKTISARQVGEVLRVSIPATMTKAEEEKWVGEMVRRMERRAKTEPIDLVARSRLLAARHDLPLPDTIRWVDNQAARWGSCTPLDRSIRISTRIAGYPGWVVDYVLVHEMAHLIEPSHNGLFWAICARYPLTERARGYLLAKGLDEDE